MKILFALMITVMCLAMALLPELAMYGLYKFINPTTELARILMFAIFWIFGIGLCIGSAILSFIIWVGLMAGLLK